MALFVRAFIHSSFRTSIGMGVRAVRGGTSEMSVPICRTYIRRTQTHEKIERKKKMNKKEKKRRKGIIKERMKEVVWFLFSYTSNGGYRREEKSRKHWSLFIKLLSSVTAIFFICSIKSRVCIDCTENQRKIGLNQMS